MLTMKATMRSSDGVSVEEARWEFSEEEWSQLLSFHREAERLRLTRFVQNRRGGQISITWSIDAPVRSHAAIADPEEVCAMLMKLRPFVLMKEALYFHKIKKLLKHRLTHRAFRRQLDLLDEAFSLRGMQQRVKIRGQGRSPLSEAVVMDWLNAYEYHRDDSKRQQVARDLGIFGQNQDGLPLIVFALVDIVQSVIDLGSLVETLMQVNEGHRSEIECAPDFMRAES